MAITKPNLELLEVLKTPLTIKELVETTGKSISAIRQHIYFLTTEPNTITSYVINLKPEYKEGTYQTRTSASVGQLQFVFGEGKSPQPPKEYYQVLFTGNQLGAKLLIGYSLLYSYCFDLVEPHDTKNVTATTIRAYLDNFISELKAITSSLEDLKRSDVLLANSRGKEQLGRLTDKEEQQVKKLYLWWAGTRNRQLTGQDWNDLYIYCSDPKEETTT